MIIDPATILSRRFAMIRAILIISLALFSLNCNKHNEPDTRNPTIDIAGISDCKTHLARPGIFDTTSNFDCIEYTYQTPGILVLRHVNAGFNCCPEIDTDIEVDGDVITIREIETSSQCDCNCLFDLDLEVRDISAGIYQIRVIEPYVNPNDEEMVFTVDLTIQPTGTFCVERTYYPWGVD
jgi:hypothetical protein